MEQHQNNDNKFDVGFYDLRYQKGYMDTWPSYKMQRVFNYLTDLKGKIGIPDKILDFGGGTGVFSEVISRVFPSATIYICDLSAEALQIAVTRNPKLKAYTLSELEKETAKFDLIFSHHVLEHVDDLNATLNLIKSVLNLKGSMVHILPCGNKESLEYNLCTWQKSGFRGEKGDLFYFDEEAHLRRLTSDGMNKCMFDLGLECVDQRFANHYMGTLIIFGSYKEKLINTILNPETAIDEKSATQINKVRSAAGMIKRNREVFETGFQQIWKEKIPLNQKILLFIKKLFSGKSYLKYLKQEENEWDNLQNNPNGSEMYLTYKFR